MAWRIVLQPNGLFARFSDIVDCFTVYDMTEREAWELCRDAAGVEVADKKIKAAKEDWKPWTEGVIGSGHDRWDDCLQIIRRVHGDAEAEKFVPAAHAGERRE